jgi:hypothetical protein
MLAKAQVILHKTSELPAYRILLCACSADRVARWLLDAIADGVAERSS